MRGTRIGLLLATTLLLWVSALTAQETGLRVVASHSIAADVVARVAGPDAEVMTLIPRGQDPHSFRATPAALRAVADADLVFINGAGFEEALLPAIEQSVAADALVTLSACVAILPGGHEHHEHHDDEHHDDDEEHEAEHAEDEHHDDDGHEAEHAADEHHDDDEHEAEHVDADEHHDDDDRHEAMDERCAGHEAELGERFRRLPEDSGSPGALHAVGCATLEGCDPHVWMLPRNIAHWALMARDALSARDSEHAAAWQARSVAYLDEIAALEAEVLLPLIAQLPAERRLLVSNHRSFSYLAAGYGFEEAGSVLPGQSTVAQPGMAQLAALVDMMRARGVPAVFSETTADDDLARQVAAEAGAQLVMLYTGSLGAVDGPAGTWSGMMRSNVAAIVDALSVGAAGG